MAVELLAVSVAAISVIPAVRAFMGALRSRHADERAGVSLQVDFTGTPEEVREVEKDVREVVRVHEQRSGGTGGVEVRKDSKPPNDQE